MSSILTRYEDESLPPADSLSPDYRLGWAMAALCESEGFYANQPNYDKIRRTSEMLYGLRTTFRDVIGLSTTQVNHFLRIFKILSADITDTRLFWNYTTHNRANENQARLHTNLATAWYQRTSAYRQLSLVNKRALISGSGIAHLHWDPRLHDLRMTAMNPLDVLPVRPHSLDSYQDCLAVIIRKECTVNSVRQQWKRFAPYIKADRDAAVTGLGLRHREMARSYIRTPSIIEAANANDGIPDSKLGALPVVDLFYLYIDDHSTNDSAQPIVMGDWGRRTPNSPFIPFNFWSYEVEPHKEKYPFKRLIIFTRHCILYDGPSQYWHGMFPVAKFTPFMMDEQDFLGQSPMWPLLDLQGDLNRIYQAKADHIQRVLRPPVRGDQFSGAALRKADPRKAGERWQQDARGKGLEVVDFPPLDPAIEEQRQIIIDDMEQIAGVKNITSLMSLNQLPEGETVEKLLRAMTPEIREISRNLEVFQSEVGQMMMYNFAEFYDEPRRFEIFGEDGLTPEDFDYDPYSMIPAYTNGDFAGDGQLDPSREDIDLRPRYVRAREHFRKFGMNVGSGTLIESARQSRRLQIMLMRQMKPPEVDRYTFLKEMDMTNLGPEPPGTIPERLDAELMKSAMMAAGMMPGGPGGMGGPPNPFSRPEGNERSYSAPPSIEGNGIRTSE